MIGEQLVHARCIGLVNGPNQEPYRLMDYRWVDGETLFPRGASSAIRIETTYRQVIPVKLAVY